MNNSINRRKPLLSRVCIKAEVVFGSPGRGCAGSGVCRLIPFQQMDKWNETCSKFETKINWYSHGSLDFILDLSKFNSDERYTWFSDPCFLVEEDFRFPLWFQYELGQKNMYIPAGKYPYSIKENQLKIFFPWEKENNNTNKIIGSPLLLHAQ